MSNVIKSGIPISPDNIPSIYEKKPLVIIPNEVFDSFNELIVLEYNYNSDAAEVLETDVIELIKKKLPCKKIDLRWFEIEDIYHKAGWEVTRDYYACEPSFYFRKLR